MTALNDLAATIYANDQTFAVELVLQGFEVTVQTVTINNTDTYHRVRIGPFKDLDALNKVRSQLNKQGIENKLIKITG